MESQAHKYGYNMADAEGKYAPIVPDLAPSSTSQTMSEAERLEHSRLPPGRIHSRDGKRRGFGEGYEQFSEELFTSIDVENLVATLKRSGVEVRNFTPPRLNAHSQSANSDLRRPWEICV